MNEIPLLGWVCLGSIVFMVIGLYLSLLAAWRKTDQNSQSRPMQGTQILNTLPKPKGPGKNQRGKKHPKKKKNPKKKTTPPPKKIYKTL